MSKGTPFNITVDVKNIQKGLEKKQTQLGKALDATVKDFKSRAPGWISKEIKKVYSIKKGLDITDYLKKPIKDGHIRVGLEKVDNIKIIYEGQLLTPTHFGMTPDERPEFKGKKGNRKYAKRYTVKATILKGRKIKIASDAYLARTGGAKDKSEQTQIPWRRVGKTRTPVCPVKTIAVPQMVTSDRTSEAIQISINENMEKRLNNQLKRFNV